MVQESPMGATRLDWRNLGQQEGICSKAWKPGAHLWACQRTPDSEEGLVSPSHPVLLQKASPPFKTSSKCLIWSRGWEGEPPVWEFNPQMEWHPGGFLFLTTAPGICSAFKFLSAAVSEHCWSSLCFFLRVQLAGLIPGWKGAWEHFWEYHRYLCFLWLLLLCPLFCSNEVIGSLVFKSADNTWRDIPSDTAYTAGLCSVEVIMVPVDAIYVKQALIFSLQ